MALADIIQLPYPSEDPMTTSVADEFMTTFNTTTEQSLLDGFDATTITGLAIGCIFMLVMIFLPCYWVCKKSRRGWRKQSTTSGPSDRVYSNSDYTSEDRRRKSKSDLYSENESGYKSESDFRCVSEYKSESEFQSEAPETVEDVHKNNTTLNIENEKNKPKKSENQEDKGKDKDRKDQDNEIKDTDKLMENDKREDKVDGTAAGQDKDDGIENDFENNDEGGSTWL